MQRMTPLALGETYHVFNRGAHKQAIFTSEVDHERFMFLLFLLNTDQPIVVREVFSAHRGESYEDLYKTAENKDGSRLVDILAFALMPNHFHLVLSQITDNGITRFLQKLCTSYSMYFNKKYDHSGTLFQGPFKSSHIDSDAYHRWIFAYVHLNPIDLVQSGWKEAGIQNPDAVREFLNNYRHSSFYDYSVGERPERAILAYDEAPDFLKTQNDLEELLEEEKRGRFIYDETALP